MSCPICQEHNRTSTVVVAKGKKKWVSGEWAMTYKCSRGHKWEESDSAQSRVSRVIAAIAAIALFLTMVLCHLVLQLHGISI